MSIGAMGRWCICAAAILSVAVLLWAKGNRFVGDICPIDRTIKVPCTIAEANADRAERLAVWTALNEQYRAATGRETSTYDYSGVDFPKAFYDCIVGVDQKESNANGLFRYVVTVDRAKLEPQIERSWESALIKERDIASLRSRRMRLRKAVNEIGYMLTDYPTRIYNATRIGMFEISKEDRSDSVDTTVDTIYEMKLCQGAFEKFENRFRSATDGIAFGSKAVLIKNFNESRIREAYESFWDESGCDKSLGHCVVSFLEERADNSFELRMMIVPAQVHKAVRKSISSDSVMEFTFGLKDSDKTISRFVKTEVSFWRKPYTEFSDSESRPIEFHNWIGMEIDNRRESFSKREIRQGFGIPSELVKCLSRCDIRIRSGKNAKDILKATQNIP